MVKVGGELAADRARFAKSIGAAIVAFQSSGIKVAVVHGAGPQATELTQKLGVEPKMISGRRFTDDATLEIMKMTLGGQVSVDLAAGFRLAKVNAICTTGVSSGLVDAKRRPPKVYADGEAAVDLGLVGDVTAVNTVLFEKFAMIGVVPVLASLAGDAQGAVFNINADTVATRVAAALKAAKLFLVSNVPGVLADKNDPKTRIPTLTPSQARAKIASKVIAGGMIPKVEESLEMLEQGIDSIHIVGIDPPDSLLIEAQNPGSRGTAFLRN